MSGRAERSRAVHLGVAPPPYVGGGLWPEGRFDTPIRRALAALGDGGAEPAPVAASVVCALDPVPVPEVEPLIQARATRADRDPSFGMSDGDASPFVHAWLVARGLRGAAPGALASETLRHLVRALAGGPPTDPLDCAAATVALFDLDAVGPELHPLVAPILEQQQPSGVWRSAHGHVATTTALCVQALYRYSRAGRALFRPPHLLPASVGAVRKPRPGSLDAMFEEIASCVPSALVSPEALGDLRASVCHLPVEMVSGLGLECRLGDPEPRADLLLLVQALGRRILGGDHPQVRLPAPVAEDPIWRRIAGLCRFHAQRTAGAAALLDDLWLELDVSGAADTRATPSVFITFRDGDAGLAPAAAAIERHELAVDALEQLWGHPVPEAMRARLQRCHQLLPRGGELFAVGAMLARQWEAARVCFKNVALRAVPPLLEDLEWPGAMPEVRQWLDALAPRVDRIFINLDIGTTVFPTLGLECKFRRPAPEEPRWPALLAYLQDRGLCRDEKRRGLLYWPGPLYSEQVLEGETWVSSFDNMLTHVKVGFRLDGTIEAKAYIGAWRGYSAPMGPARRDP
jgi:hypothetical protein